MTNVNEEFRELQIKTLEDMKRRRDSLDRGIANLENVLNNPNLGRSDSQEYYSENL